MITTFAIHVEDKPGVLTRVSSLFRRRAFNIESLTVGHTDRPGVSRMTIVVDTDELGARRIEAHIYKLVNVLRVENITLTPAVFRDLAMIKVAASAESRTHIMQLVDVFRARVVDVAPDSLIIEITGTEDKIDGLLEVLRPYGVLEMVRTGRVAMSRGLRSATAGPVGRGARRRRRSERISLCVACLNAETRRRREISFQEENSAPLRLCVEAQKRTLNGSEDVLRQRRGSRADSREESGHHRLRLAGARARAESEGQRRAGEGGPRGRTASRRRRPKRTACR